jgi:hypothetical protein
VTEEVYTFMLSVKSSVSASTTDGMGFCVSFTLGMDEMVQNNNSSEKTYPKDVVPGCQRKHEICILRESMNELRTF